jgi:hypothetical protein
MPDLLLDLLISTPRKSLPRRVPEAALAQGRAKEERACG